MSIKHLLVVAAALLASCSLSEGGRWKLIESGYSINPFPDSDQFAIAVHANELKQLGGDVKTAQFRLFVSERLKREGLCPRGWEPLPCTQDGSCVSRARDSVMVLGRCVAP
jgi:hypothetical protein